MTDDVKTLRNQARSAYNLGQAEQAIKLQQSLIQQQAQDSGKVPLADYRQLAFFLLAVKRPAEAVSVLKPVVSARPDNADLRSILGLCYTNLKQYNDAEPHLRGALEIDQDCFLAADQLARCYLGSGQLEKAKRAGETALAIKDRLYAANDTVRIIEAVPPYDEASKRGKVIAFSLWGQDSRYLDGAVRNCELAAELYPGWQCRFYLDDSVPQHVVENLGARGADVRRMPTRKHLYEGLFWRFRVVSDTKISRFLIRDCDAVVNVKERVAVEQWLHSDKHFHVMRDYFTHTDLVMAGMWGGVTGVIPDIEKLIEGFLQKHIQSRVMDQVFLNECLWSIIRQSCLIHDRCFDAYQTQAYPAYCELPPGRHIGQDESAVRRTRD